MLWWFDGSICSMLPVKCANIDSITLPVAWEGSIPGPQSDISEHALFPHGVQMSQDTVRMWRLVEQWDVHGARAGAGFTMLMNGHRHSAFVWYHQGVTLNNLFSCSTTRMEKVILLHQQLLYMYLCITLDEVNKHTRLTCISKPGIRAHNPTMLQNINSKESETKGHLVLFCKIHPGV